MRYGGNTSCVDVQLADGTRVVLDAGTGIRGLGAALPAAGPSRAGGRPVITVVLTHRHSDHLIGLAHFSPIITRSHQVRIACGGVAAAALRTIVEQQLSAPLFPTLDGVTDALSVEAFDDAGCFRVSATCDVQAIPARHPGGASVLVVRDATGPVLAYAPDNELSFADAETSVLSWRLSLMESLRRIPVLIHDATYTDDELARHRGWGHSSAAEATQLAIACRADVLLLTHHHPDRTDTQVDALAEQCRALGAAAGSSLVVVAAAEGMSLEVA